MGVWRLATGSLEHVLHGHSRMVDLLPARWSSDSRFFITGGEDRMILIWDRETGLVRHTLLGHRDAIAAYAISPDDKRIASRDAKGTIKVWDMTHGTEVLSFDSGANLSYNHRLSWSADGKVLLGHVEQGEIWSAHRGYQLAESGELQKDFELARSAMRGSRLTAEEQTASEFLVQALDLIKGFRLNLHAEEDAAQAASAAVLLEPENPDAWVVWAMTLYLDNHWKSALSKIERAEALGFGSMRCEALAVRATIEYRLGKGDEGELAFEEARAAHLKGDQNRSVTQMLKHAELAQILYRIEQEDKPPEALFARRSELMFEFSQGGEAAVFLHQAFDDQGMARALVAIVEKDPVVAETAIYWVGRKASIQAKTAVKKELLAFFNRRIKEEPDISRWKEHRTSLLLIMESEEAYQIENPHARNIVAEVLVGDLPSFEQELIVHPDAGREAGFFLSRSGRDEAAKNCLKTYLGKHPRDAWAQA
ncbi:MAG: hypothetical protein AAF492_22315, partial [Verrucomicrobiota bacterium]